MLLCDVADGHREKMQKLLVMCDLLGAIWLRPNGLCQEPGWLPVSQTIADTCDEWLNGLSSTDPAALA